jgi:hypothetical protein
MAADSYKRLPAQVKIKPQIVRDRAEATNVRHRPVHHPSGDRGGSRLVLMRCGAPRLSYESALKSLSLSVSTGSSADVDRLNHIAGVVQDLELVVQAGRFALQRFCAKDLARALFSRGASSG